MFGYNWKYLIAHPWKIAGYCWAEIRFAWQRVFRGWDDRAVWSIDYYLAKLIPELVLELKENKIGYPARLLPDDIGDDWSEEQSKKAKEKWDSVLDEIAEGFQYYSDSICDWGDQKEIDEKLKASMDLLAEYFGALWN